MYGDENQTVASTQKETDRKCPACGGTMDYDPVSKKLKCPYCDYEEEIQVEEENFVAKEIDFSQAEDEALSNWGTQTKIVICKNCGAETVYDAHETAGECPYCGSNQVMEQTDENTMAPSGVIPFQMDAKKASDLFRSWIKGKFFCPKKAKESAKADSFKGIYIPFWTFDADTDSSYHGEYGKDRQVQKDGKKVTETDWYSTSGYYEESFDDVLVCGSSNQNEGAMRALEPYDTTKAVAYKPEYLAGFMAERYSIKVKSAWETAKERIRSMIRSNVESKIRREHNADHTRNVTVNPNYRNITFKYLLLPVWISSYTYQGKVYQFRINGQTGRVSGSTPISWIKVALVVGIIALILAFFLFGQDADAAVRAAVQAGI